MHSLMKNSVNGNCVTTFGSGNLMYLGHTVPYNMRCAWFNRENIMNPKNIERNKQLKVAQFANPSTQGKEPKGQARLNARRADYTKTINDPMNRGKDMSGYHRPGSVQGNR